MVNCSCRYHRAAHSAEDLLDPIAEIQALQMVLRWSKSKISQTLMTEYGVATRSRLTEADLIHYRRLLRVEVQKRRDAILAVDRCVGGGAHELFSN